MKTRGIHLIADFWGCSREILENQPLLEELLKEAALHSGASLRKIDSHRFDPNSHPYSVGVTAFAILAESHLAIHTFPEEGFASLDIYTCGNRCDPRRGFEYLKQQLRPARISFKEIIRGEPSAL